MKNRAWSLQGFFIATSILEGTTGLALMIKPSFITSLLLGSSLIDLLGILIARIAGGALVSIAIACWFSRKNKEVKGLLIALFLYNLTSFVLLAHAGLNDSLIGIALWPAIATHIVMALWCITVLYLEQNLNNKKPISY